MDLLAEEERSDAKIGAHTPEERTPNSWFALTGRT